MALDAACGASNMQVDGCVQGNMAPSLMMTGGQESIDETQRIKDAFPKGPHIFRPGHGFTPMRTRRSFTPMRTRRM
ncbi:uroporphyrinogen-III decarboxylase [Rhodovulum iodosum]|uniref:Uroporphyrinogen-III decarboxylase n=1 Tax=Rhodovulum iodosum TaxID=68291 RepID=A0ABV3XQV5_9RHOB